MFQNIKTRVAVAKKKFYFIFFGLVFCVVSANSQTWQVGSPNPASITARLSGGTLTIDGTGAMRNWTLGSPAPWENVRFSITTINFIGDVTSIGNYAFWGLTNLTNITIPNSVTAIGDYAFYAVGWEGEGGLYSITIPNNVTSIGRDAFHGCFRLVEVIIGNSVTSISDNAFNSCTSLTSVVIPNSVTSIGDNAFNSCTSLTSVVIPNSVTSIGMMAFYRCTSLTSVVIPNSVTSIGTMAFGGCNALTSIEVEVDNPSFSSIDGVVFDKNVEHLILYPPGRQGEYAIPNSVTAIGNNAFSGCTGLTSVVIPNSVTAIGNNAFRGCTGLTSADIANGVTAIGYDAFRDCTALTSVTIPNSVTSIGADAFRDCTALTSVIIPNSVASIGFSAFMNCSSLTHVTIGNGVTFIGNQAFSNCSRLSSVTVLWDVPLAINSNVFGTHLNSTLLTIPQDAFELYSNASVWRDFYFEGISSLAGTCGENLTWSYTPVDKKLTISGTGEMMEMIGYPWYPWNDFREKIQTLVLPDGLTSISAVAFYQCTGLTSVTIPNSVTSIGYSAFAQCTGLTSVIIPNSVTSIGVSAFVQCIGLTSVTIPNSVTSIGNSAFAQCTGLTSVTIPNSVVSIGRSAFSGCISLTSVTIPNSVTSIGIGAFNGCISLTSVAIPNSVTSIGNSAFRWCTGLLSLDVEADNLNYSSIDGILFNKEGTTLLQFPSGRQGEYSIPNSVTSIGEGAFSGCIGLTFVTIPNSVTAIGNNAFNGCSGLTSVILGNSITSIGDSAFSGCTGLTSVILGNSVTSIGEGSFSGCTNLTSVSIGHSVTSIGRFAFDDCTNLQDIINHSATPQAIDIVVFRNVNSSANLHVPTSSIVAYRAAPFWNVFNIVAIVPYVAVEEIIDLPSAATVNVPLELTGAVYPVNATNQTVDWSVSNAGNTDAVIIGNTLFVGNDGVVIILATVKDGVAIGVDFEKTFSITVSAGNIEITSITVSGNDNASTITTNGGTLQMNANVLPVDATDITVLWSVINETGSGTINADGLLTAITNGTITVRATANDGSGVYGEQQITISGQIVHVTSIVVSSSDNTTTITSNGGTLQMDAMLLPNNATNGTVSWSVIDGTGSATINSSGLLTAATNGTVTIRATANDGSGIFGELHITISGQNVTSAPEVQAFTTSLHVFVRNGLLHVSGLRTGEVWSVYSVSGALIYRDVATDEEVEVAIRAQGVYIVQSGERTVRVVVSH